MLKNKRGYMHLFHKWVYSRKEFTLKTHSLYGIPLSPETVTLETRKCIKCGEEQYTLKRYRGRMIDKKKWVTISDRKKIDKVRKS